MSILYLRYSNHMKAELKNVAVEFQVYRNEHERFCSYRIAEFYLGGG